MKISRVATSAALVAALAVPGAASAHGVTRHHTRAATPQAVARDMVAGATEFAGTHPMCRTVVAGARYRCTIAGGAPYDNLPTLTHAQGTLLTLAPPGQPDAGPAADRAYQEGLLLGFGWTPAQAEEYASGTFPQIYAGDFAGANEPTVNAVTHRVNGGCEAQNANGSVWDCYLGEAAVRAGQASPGFLGKKVSGPITK